MGVFLALALGSFFVGVEDAGLFLHCVGLVARGVLVWGGDLVEGGQRALARRVPCRVHHGWVLLLGLVQRQISCLLEHVVLPFLFVLGLQ